MRHTFSRTGTNAVIRWAEHQPRREYLAERFARFEAA
jgi:hypothetical protein